MEYVKLKVNIPEGAPPSRKGLHRTFALTRFGVCHIVVDIPEQDRQSYDDEMVAAFFSAVEKHKSGENKDMDIAVYGATGYSFVGFLIVRCVTMDVQRAMESHE